MSEGNAPTFCIIHYQSALLADDPDHKTLFLHNHELYDVPAHADYEADVQVMHELLGPLHTQDEIREKYDQLQEHAGLGPRGVY